MQPYNSTDWAIAWKNFKFYSIFHVNIYFHIDIYLTIYLFVCIYQYISVHDLAMRVLTSLSVDEILLPRHISRSTNFRGLSFDVEIASF